MSTPVPWTFPAARAWVKRSTGNEPLGDASASAGAAGTVLVVDDDPGILGMVAGVLELEGYAVRTAAGGDEALAILERERPAVILLDMRMPVTDGWAVAAAMKDRGLKVPVVVMTAAQDARGWAEEIGADGYVAKPFAIDDLLEAVQAALTPRQH